MTGRGLTHVRIKIMDGSLSPQPHAGIISWTRFLFFPNRTYHLFPRDNVINLNEKVLHSSAKAMNCSHESAEVGDALGFVD